MIFTAFIAIAYYVLGAILSIFPSSSGFPSQVDSAIAYVAGYVGILDPLVPLSTLATILSLIITFELSVFAFKGIKWLISHIPFVGGKG